MALWAGAEGDRRLVGVLDPPVGEAVHELAMGAVELEEALRMFAREIFHLASELSGC